MIFHWDNAKADANFVKHGVSFDSASDVFLDPLAASFFDVAHSDIEDRFITVGRDNSGRLIYVVHTDGATVRIISARLATNFERTRYDRNN